MKAIEKLRTERDNIVQKQQEIEQAIQCHRTELESLKKRISAAFVAGEPVDKLQQEKREIMDSIAGLEDIQKNIDTDVLKPLIQSAIDEVRAVAIKGRAEIEESAARVKVFVEEHNRKMEQEASLREGIAENTINLFNQVAGLSNGMTTQDQEQILRESRISPYLDDVKIIRSGKLANVRGL